MTSVGVVGDCNQRYIARLASNNILSKVPKIELNEFFFSVFVFSMSDKPKSQGWHKVFCNGEQKLLHFVNKKCLLN